MKRKNKLAGAMQPCIALLIILGAVVQGASGIQITASGDSSGASGSTSMNFDGLKTTTLRGQMVIDGADITPFTAIEGPIAKFEETHSVKDSSGKYAEVSVKVLNAPSGITYTSRVLPGRGNVATQPQVSAEQWLTVPEADSIKCTASSSYGTLSANVGLEEAKNALLTGDYATITEYYGKASTTGTSALASQTATSGKASYISISGTSKDSIGTYSVNTPLGRTSSGRASFTELSAISSAGTTTGVTQEGHLKGSFTSTAQSGTKTETRTSNYGNEYDLNMQAKKGLSVSGTLGYYVSPTTSANKIQGAIDAAQSGDTINAAAGTYKENIAISKSVTINGAGSGKTIVDGNQAGRAVSVNEGNVVFDGMTLKNGKAVSGAGIANAGTGTLTLNDVSITGNTATDKAGGIYNYGTVNFNSGSIDHNSGGRVGGGVYNDGTFNMNGGSITNNNAYYGAGLYSWKTANVKDVKISSNTGYQGCGIYTDGILNVYGGSIDHNVADGKAAGIYVDGAGQATIDGSSISYNTADIGGGVYNDGVATLKDVSIVNNKADYGGGVYNWGTANLNSGSISQNTANKKGGGIYSDGIVNMYGSSIDHNVAIVGAGGLYINGAGQATINSGSISYNTANIGGGVYNDGLMTLKKGSIANNKANYGGGVYNWGTANLNDGGSISQNTANKEGGGIYNDMTVKINGASISKNVAPYGGGIFNSHGTVRLYSGSISDNTATILGGGIFNWDTITGDRGIVYDNIPS